MLAKAGNMKFMLVITLCSQIYATCLPPFEQDYFYDNYFDCATLGHMRGFDTLHKLGADRVNADRMIYMFECKPILNT
jgi:hypothetical protein